MPAARSHKSSRWQSASAEDRLIHGKFEDRRAIWSGLNESPEREMDLFQDSSSLAAPPRPLGACARYTKTDEEEHGSRVYFPRVPGESRSGRSTFSGSVCLLTRRGDYESLEDPERADAARWTPGNPRKRAEWTK